MERGSFAPFGKRDRSMEKQKYYITTAIAYTSRKPHIGNVYDPVLADAIARFKRMAGFDVFYLTGSDEHGQKIEELAKEAGISPKEYVDGVAAQIKDVWDCMNVSYDRFIRTTDADHEAAVEKFGFAGDGGGDGIRCAENGKKDEAARDQSQGSKTGFFPPGAFCRKEGGAEGARQNADGNVPVNWAKEGFAPIAADPLPTPRRKHTSCASPNTPTVWYSITKRIPNFSHPFPAKRKWSTTSLSPVLRIFAFPAPPSLGASR